MENLCDRHNLNTDNHISKINFLDKFNISTVTVNQNVSIH